MPCLTGCSRSGGHHTRLAMLMVLTSVPQNCVNSLWASVAPFPWLLLKPQHQGALFGDYRCGSRSPLPLIPTLSRGLTRDSVWSTGCSTSSPSGDLPELPTGDQTEGKENQCCHPLSLTLELFCPYLQKPEHGIYLIPPLSKQRPPKRNHGPVALKFALRTKPSILLERSTWGTDWLS